MGSPLIDTFYSHPLSKPITFYTNMYILFSEDINIIVVIFKIAT